MLFIFFICLGLISGKKLSILLNIDIKHSKIKKFLTNAYKEIELKRIIRFSFSFSVLTYLFWVIFVNVSDILSAQFLALICSVFCLMYFLTQFYSSSSTGETEDVIKMIEYAMSIKPKSHDFEIKKDDFNGYIDRYMNQTGG